MGYLINLGSLAQGLWGIPFNKPRQKPKKLFKERFSNKELCPQSCINENVLEDKRVSKKRMGISKPTFVICKRGEYKILETINHREIIGMRVVINW